MRIAVFYNLNFGGAKRAVFEQVKRLKDKGHSIDVYTTDKLEDAFSLKNVCDNYYQYGFSYHQKKIPFITRVINDIKTFYFLNRLHKKIAKDIDGRNYDMVLVHPDKETQAAFLLRHLKTKSAYYCQEPLRIAYEYVLKAKRNIGLMNYIYEIITRRIRKNIDLINVRSATFTLASCFHVRERMIEAYGVYPHVSYLGVDTKVFRPKKIKKQNQIFFVGNKNVWNDGYDLVKKSINKIDPSYRPRIKLVEWIKNNNERLTDEELADKYSQSFATLCLSRLETFGLVPLESMACGTPVIATNISGHRETIISGKGGFLVEFDADEIANKIIELSKNPKHIKYARSHVKEEWDWQKRIDEFEKLLFILAKKND